MRTETVAQILVLKTKLITKFTLKIEKKSNIFFVVYLLNTNHRVGNSWVNTEILMSLITHIPELQNLCEYWHWSTDFWILCPFLLCFLFFYSTSDLLFFLLYTEAVDNLPLFSKLILGHFSLEVILNLTFKNSIMIRSVNVLEHKINPLPLLLYLFLPC